MATWAGSVVATSRTVPPDMCKAHTSSDPPPSTSARTGLGVRLKCCSAIGSESVAAIGWEFRTGVRRAVSGRPIRGHSGTLAQSSIDSAGVLESRVVTRFAAVRLAAAVVAAFTLGATLLVAAALPWNPLPGLPHRCPYGAPAHDCVYPARPAWVLPTAVAIGLIGLAGASAVLRATRRHRIPERMAQPGGRV